MLSSFQSCNSGILLVFISATVIPLMLSRLSVLSFASKSLMSSSASPYSMVFVTAPSKDVAKELASGIGELFAAFAFS